MANIAVETKSAQYYAALPLTVSYGNLHLRVSEAFDALGGYFRSRGIEPAGPSLIRFKTKHPERPFAIEVGWVVARDAWIEAPYIVGTIPGGRYVTSRDEGVYRDLAALEREMIAWARAEAVELDSTEDRTGTQWAANVEFHPAERGGSVVDSMGPVEICLLTK